MKTITLSAEPSTNDNYQVYDDFIVKLSLPYNEKQVAIKINPMIVEYKENISKSEMEIRQLNVTKDTNETRFLHFDIENDNEHTFVVEGNTYRIRLLDILKDRIDGEQGNFYKFRFEIGKI